jgi:hypothetical protein
MLSRYGASALRSAASARKIDFKIQRAWLSGVRQESPHRKQVLDQEMAARPKPKRVPKPKTLMTGSNILLFGGVVIYSLIYINHYFQQRQRDRMQQELETMYKEFGDLDELKEKHKDAPNLFYCVVRMRYPGLKDIVPIEVGDVVEVVLESVGEGGAFNLIRTRPKSPNDNSVVCPYPMGCLQRLPGEL